MKLLSSRVFRMQQTSSSSKGSPAELVFRLFPYEGFTAAHLLRCIHHCYEQITEPLHATLRSTKLVLRMFTRPSDCSDTNTCDLSTWKLLLKLWLHAKRTGLFGLKLAQHILILTCSKVNLCSVWGLLVLPPVWVSPGYSTFAHHQTHDC